MYTSLQTPRTKPVALWLLVGVFMIMIQVWLGGVTRLTGSGLSITRWNPIMGAIPPMNHRQWITAFNLYRQTPQFRLQNSGISLPEFKHIFFWEWLHRIWARSLGVVFLIPFLLFLWQKRFNRTLSGPLLILFLLGGLQGLIGWLMVESGLVGDNIRVNHLKLAAHFLTAMILLGYTFWFALRLLVPAEQRFRDRSLRRLTWWILVLLVLQLAYGSFMAGLHAALVAPTWPDIQGNLIPRSLFTMKPWPLNLIDNPITVQFIHRTLAYVLVCLMLAWWIGAGKRGKGSLMKKFRILPPVLILLQALLGILTLVNSRVQIPIGLAVTHQFMAMLVLLAMLLALYLTLPETPKG